MPRKLKVTHEAWPLAKPFRISRGVKTVADVVVVEITDNGVRGRGEGVPYPRYGESVASVLEEIRALEHVIADGLTRDDLQGRIPAGAARNAIDCALWELAARLSGQ
jgi:L-alanine-DL-glutamate epimerase-like enolase superfamily enzyme